MLNRDELAAAFAKKFPAVLSQYSQFKIVDWFLSQVEEAQRDAQGSINHMPDDNTH